MLSRDVITKLNYVKELGAVLPKYHGNIVKVNYQVFVDEEEDVVGEYLIVDYTGGAKSVRNCHGNSCSAIFEELSKLIDHCHWTEVEYYKQYFWNNTDLTIVDCESEVK